MDDQFPNLSGVKVHYHNLVAVFKKKQGSTEGFLPGWVLLKGDESKGQHLGAQPPQRSRAVTHHLVQGGHQHAQGGERHPQNAELHVVVGVEENTQRDGDLWRGTRRF